VARLIVSFQERNRCRDLIFSLYLQCYESFQSYRSRSSYLLKAQQHRHLSSQHTGSFRTLKRFKPLSTPMKFPSACPFQQRSASRFATTIRCPMHFTPGFAVLTIQASEGSSLLGMLDTRGRGAALSQLNGIQERAGGRLQPRWRPCKGRVSRSMKRLAGCAP